MSNLIDTTPEFESWLDSIKDPVGNGVSEMRVFIGPGYHIYYVRTGMVRYLMLYGSDKTDQGRGIKRAKEILDALRGK